MASFSGLDSPDWALSVVQQVFVVGDTTIAYHSPSKTDNHHWSSRQISSAFSLIDRTTLDPQLWLHFLLQSDQFHPACYRFFRLSQRLLELFEEHKSTSLRSTAKLQWLQPQLRGSQILTMTGRLPIHLKRSPNPTLRPWGQSSRVRLCAGRIVTLATTRQCPDGLCPKSHSMQATKSRLKRAPYDLRPRQDLLCIRIPWQGAPRAHRRPKSRLPLSGRDD